LQTDLFTLDARCLKDGPPLLDLGLLQIAQRLRGLLLARDDLVAKLDEAAAHRGVSQHIPDRGLSDFPHHFNDAAPALIVENITELTSEVVQINRAAVGGNSVID
jgi:hypothetical protein